MAQEIDEDGMHAVAQKRAFSLVYMRAKEATMRTILAAPEKSCADAIAAARAAIVAEVRESADWCLQADLGDNPELGRYGWISREADDTSLRIVHAAIDAVLPGAVLLAERRAICELSHPLKRALLTGVAAYEAWHVVDHGNGREPPTITLNGEPPTVTLDGKQLTIDQIYQMVNEQLEQWEPLPTVMLPKIHSLFEPRLSNYVGLAKAMLDLLAEHDPAYVTGGVYRKEPRSVTVSEDPTAECSFLED